MNLPNNILPGDYLIRHEVPYRTISLSLRLLTKNPQIIALQIAVSMGGAEFYPSCTQVRVGGNGNGAPNATVSFPGAYTDSDPGIYTPDVRTPHVEMQQTVFTESHYVV